LAEGAMMLGDDGLTDAQRARLMHEIKGRVGKRVRQRRGRPDLLVADVIEELTRSLACGVAIMMLNEAMT